MGMEQDRGSVEQIKLSKNTDLAPKDSSQVVDHYLCSRCDQKLPWHEKDEHEDWHFAKDLEANDEDGTTTSQRPAPTAPQPQAQSLKHGTDSKNDQPHNYAPPSYPPPNASRTTAIRPHTNQVIEAAKVRARDEVRFTSRSGIEVCP